jgi:tRNA(Ile2)-agmatinylcytidine synthase
LVNALLEEFQDFSIVDYPYLVRLNPNIPWKTRGNGAVCLQLKPSNTKGSTQVDEISTDEFHDYISRIERIIQSAAELNDENTNPGFVVTTQKLPIEFYWSAVRSVVDLNGIKKRLNKLGVKFRGFKKGRGIIGASAAISWASNLNSDTTINQAIKTDQLDYTYELITYRMQSNWGTPRTISKEAVKELDVKFPSTFNNYDPETGHIAITPNSPCPVLFGVRGESMDELHEALRFLTHESEPFDKWLLFQTNQGTDDHLIPTKISNIQPFTSVITSGLVAQPPLTISGGHVFFDLTNGSPDLKNQRVTCAAYEPTKGFRKLVRGLLPGDKVQVYGGVRQTPLTINIEKLKLIKLVEKQIKYKNPRCPNCGRSMKSIGQQKGYRCKSCHEKVSNSAATFIELNRNLSPGFYEVPIVARRHLSKPLKRKKISTG